MNSIQADILAANKVNVARGEWGVGGLEQRCSRQPDSGSHPPPTALYPGDLSSGITGFYFGPRDQEARLPQFQQENTQGKE